MSSYKVKEVAGDKPWSGQYGPMVDYFLTLADSQGVDTARVTLTQKATSPAPQPGQALEGDLVDGQYGLTFKKAHNPAGGVGGGGGRGPKSAAEQASISAAVALKWAVDAVEQAATFGTADKPPTLEEHVALLKRYANFAFEFIQRKSKEA